MPKPKIMNAGRKRHERNRSSLPKGNWFVFFGLLKLAAIRWWKDDTFRFAAALAFYTLFSLAPIVLIAVSIASFFFVPEAAIRNIEANVQTLVGLEGARAVGQVIEASKGIKPSIPAIVVGVVTFFTGASVVFAELQAALNKIWRVRADPKKGTIIKLILDRVRSFGIALGVGFLLVVSLIASAVINTLQFYAAALLPGFPSWVWRLATETVSLLAITVLFAMIYKYLPDVRIRWKECWVGAGATAVLFTAGKYGIGIYLGQTSTAATFGATGSLAVLLIWVYYSALISFFGAEFTLVYATRSGVEIPPEGHAVRTSSPKSGVDA